MAVISAAVEGLQKRNLDSVLTGGIDGSNSNRQAVNQLPTLADFEPKPDTETAPIRHQAFVSANASYQAVCGSD